MAGSTAPWYIEQFFGPDGKPLSGGKVFFWVAGSTVIPKAIYSDIALTTPLPQPLVLDAGGFAPEYFLEPGLYKIQTFNSTMTGGAQHTRDNVQGSTTGGGSGADDHLVIANLTDPIPGALVDKTRSSQSVTITVVDVGGRKLQFDVDEDWLASWLTINYPFPADDHLVISDGTEQTAGTLSQKITDALGTVFTVNGGKQLVIPLQGRLSLTDGGHVTGPTIFDNVTIPDQFKIKESFGDIAGYYVDKIQPGAGVAFNVTVDNVNGAILHISSTEENAVTAPLDEVISGDGAGGIKSSPLFKAVDGAVAAETFRANSTAVAITAPNGSIEAKGTASVDQSAWGGAGVAFFGAKGFNSPTNDGTIAGLMVGQYSTSLYANDGGSASLGTGASRLAVYSAQAAIDVPFNGPAFNPSDCLVLTGASYTSAFHTVFAFVGTGTSFDAPAGSSLNTGLRLSNSSAVGVAITGVKTPFTLAAGTSRDLAWLLDPADMINYRWF